MIIKSPFFAVIFLPMIVFLGVITSYEDIRERKIRNKWVLLGFAYAFAVYACAWVVSVVPADVVLPSVVVEAAASLQWHFGRWCINLLVSGLIGFLLWHSRMWGAGDAKLFACYSALIPLGQYANVYFDYYLASFSLFLWIFLSACAFLLVRSLAFFVSRVTIEQVRKWPRWMVKHFFHNKNMVAAAKIVFGFIAMFYFVTLLQNGIAKTGIVSSPLWKSLPFVALLALRPLLRFFMRKSALVLVLLIGCIGYSYLFHVYQPFEMLKILRHSAGFSLGMLVALPLANKLIDIFEENAEHKTMAFAVWMFIGTLINWFF